MLIFFFFLRVFFSEQFFQEMINVGVSLSTDFTHKDKKKKKKKDEQNSKPILSRVY